MSVAAEHGMYAWLDAMYATGDVSRFNYSHWGVGNVSLLSVLETTAHTKQDLIVECEWNHQKCGLDDFRTVYTDHGICYTFNNPPDPATPLHVSETGSDSGLRLRLNLEQYEYMRGPHSAGGLKILVHPQKEFPSVRDFGDAIPAGAHAFVGVQMYQAGNGTVAMTCLSDGTKIARGVHFDTRAPRLFHVFTSTTVLHDYTTCSLRPPCSTTIPRVHFDPRAPRLHHVFTSTPVLHDYTTCSLRPPCSTTTPRVHFDPRAPRLYHVFTSTPVLHDYITCSFGPPCSTTLC
ncbi:hypothetical protein LSAT2_005730 [Lamellibrachia satsuma]|nr:hypothetical protein LSAT2_005730 [Lamellibrachia satsuma]